MAGMPTTPEAVKAAKKGYESTVAKDVYLRRSTDSAAMLAYWNLTDALVDGVEAMRDGGEKFMPRFLDEDEDEYKYRIQCTRMTNVYRDIVEGLASKPFEQEVAVLPATKDGNVPASILKFTEDVDGAGNNLTMFASAMFFNGINSAIDWIFVDSPPKPASVRTQADAKTIGLRPYWSHVLGRNVLDPRSKVINGSEVLTYIRVFEPGATDHVRIFQRDDNGVVTWELLEKREQWRDVEGGQTQFYEIRSGTLEIDQIPMVPFITARRDGRSFKLFPMMRDAADLQVELYQQESALKFAKQLTAYPMLAANGIKPLTNADGSLKRLRVGPARVLYGGFDGKGNRGEWSYVEPNASSLTFLAGDIKETIAQLRELGRQPLTAQSGNLTVITTAVAAGKAKSAVKAWAYAAKDALENAMVITCKFEGIKSTEYDPVIQVFTEFDEFIDGKDLEALISMREKKEISQPTLWHEMGRRGVLSPEFSADEETQRLLDEVPDDGEDNNRADNPPKGE